MFCSVTDILTFLLESPLGAMVIAAGLVSQAPTINRPQLHLPVSQSDWPSPGSIACEHSQFMT